MDSEFRRKLLRKTKKTLSKAVEISEDLGDRLRRRSSTASEQGQRAVSEAVEAVGNVSGQLLQGAREELRKTAEIKESIGKHVRRGRASISEQSKQAASGVAGRAASVLNRKLLREAREELHKTLKIHEDLRGQVQRNSVELFVQRQRAASEVVELVESYVNRLANTPREFEKSVAHYRVETNRFDQTVREIEVEAARTTKGTATGVTVAGAGVTVATFGPTVAMAVATTFGVASTGTAISTLSGAAATSAALAWLGGGALAAGGGGMAAGSTLLGLAGPVGWTIGSVATAGTAMMIRRRNAKLAERAAAEMIKIEVQVRSLRVALLEIEKLAQFTKTHADGCLADLEVLRQTAPSDYREFDKSEKERLGVVINHIRTLGKLLQAEVAL